MHNLLLSVPSDHEEEGERATRDTDERNEPKHDSHVLLLSGEVGESAPRAFSPLRVPTPLNVLPPQRTSFILYDFTTFLFSLFTYAQELPIEVVRASRFHPSNLQSTLYVRSYGARVRYTLLHFLSSQYL